LTASVIYEGDHSLPMAHRKAHFELRTKP